MKKKYACAYVPAKAYVTDSVCTIEYARAYAQNANAYAQRAQYADCAYAPGTFLLSPIKLGGSKQGSLFFKGMYNAHRLALC